MVLEALAIGFTAGVVSVIAAMAWGIYRAVPGPS
jgi:uncharacterized membrane protein